MTSSIQIRILSGLLCVHALLLAWGAVVHSPTIDEVAWLPGGLANWQTGRLDVVINNPPHVGLVAAIPLVLAGEKTSATAFSRRAHSIGREFIRTSGPHAFWLFTLGRWACIPFSLVGAVACFAWACALYGPRSGLVAAALWCFSPNILAQGQLVSHDVPAASLGVLSTFCFWRWLQAPSWRRTAVAGLGLGLALLTKMTMLIQLGLWPLLWLAWRASFRNRCPLRDMIGQCAQMIVIIVVALEVVNSGYAFQGSFSALGSYRFDSQSLAGLQRRLTTGPMGSILAQVPVPLPSPFVEGIDFQRSVLEGRLPYQFTYLRGEWSTHGIPYYYVYALAVKEPLGTSCLLLLSVLIRCRHVDGKNLLLDELVLLAPAIVLISTASSFLVWTDHLRHIVPALPFIYIWLSRIASLEWPRHRLWLGAATGALTASVLSSLWVYPHSMSYFNEIAGGPAGGHYHLVSSNIDYGQDLLKLKRWYDQHPEARPFGLAYWDLESIDPKIVGIEYVPVPSGVPPGSLIRQEQAEGIGPKPGWYAVNVNLLRGDEWPGRRVYPDLGYYGYFLEFTPVARAGYSIYIYHLTEADVAPVRAKLGLPPLSFTHRSKADRKLRRSCIAASNCPVSVPIVALNTIRKRSYPAPLYNRLNSVSGRNTSNDVSRAGLVRQMLIEHMR